jgi:hypothetical protein
MGTLGKNFLPMLAFFQTCVRNMNAVGAACRWEDVGSDGYLVGFRRAGGDVDGCGGPDEV